ncbi:MAG: NRDE family protein [Rhodospirillales bacterium]
MCTLLILNRPGHAWPLILGANRDEMAGRPWSPPGRHWPDRPEVVAGRDDLAGGSWLGINARGMAAAMLNRRGTLGPAKGKRSRGELVLLALDQTDAAAAALLMSELEPSSYRPFNMVVADAGGAFFIAHRAETRAPAIRRLGAGLTMLTAREPDDPSSPRIARYRAKFLAAPAPDPNTGDFAAWEALLASTERAKGAGPEGAMCFALPGGFGTVSGAVIALPARNRGPARNPGAAAKAAPVFRFAAGPPDRAPFRPVDLG